MDDPIGRILRDVLGTPEVIAPSAKPLVWGCAEWSSLDEIAELLAALCDECREGVRTPPFSAVQPYAAGKHLNSDGYVEGAGAIAWVLSPEYNA